MRNERSEIEVVLRLRDRRGRPVRVADCEDLRIKVWTQDPRNSLLFHKRNVRIERDYDVLPITAMEQAALEPGVIVYRYTFDDRGVETGDTVVTDLTCRDYGFGDHDCHRDHRDGRGHHCHGGSHGTNEPAVQLINQLKEDINGIEKDMSIRIRSLWKYIQEEYPDELKKAEDEIWKTLGPLSRRCEALGTTLTKFLADYENDQKATAEGLTGKLEEFRNELTEIKKEFRKRLNALRGTLSDQELLIEKMKTRIKGAETALETETARAKSREKILEDNIKENRRRLETLEGDARTPGSLKHGIEDAMHYTDEAVDCLRESIGSIPREEIQGWFKV